MKRKKMERKEGRKGGKEGGREWGREEEGKKERKKKTRFIQNKQEKGLKEQRPGGTKIK